MFKSICQTKPSSPNLNPLDFSIWVHVEDKACKVSHPNLVSMKKAVDRVWRSMDRDYIVRCCQGVRRRLQACAAAEGGVFEL